MAKARTEVAVEESNLPVLSKTFYARLRPGVFFMNQIPGQPFADLFPIDLTSIEKFHLFDSDEHYPNIIGCRLLVEEEIDHDLAKAAWKLAISRQPILSSRIAIRSGRLVWEYFDRSKCEPGQAPADFDFQTLPQPPSPWKIDPQMVESYRGPFLAIRCWPTSPPGGDPIVRSEIWMWAHHSIADGAGSLTFINDWLRIYGNLTNDREPLDGLKAIDAHRFRYRNRLGVLRWNYLRHLPHQVIGIFGATKFLFRRTADPYCDAGPPSDKRTSYFPAIESRWISAEDRANLTRLADNIGVTLNSLLLGELFRCLDQWRSGKTDGRASRGCIRIVLPINIRETADRRMPGANRSSIVQIDQIKPSSQSKLDLFRSIDREVKIIRNWQLDKMFLIVIRCLSLFDFTLRRAARDKKSRGYAVFTNLGRPFRVLEKTSDSSCLQPVEMDFFGPIRHGTPFNFAFAMYRGAMRITLHYDSRFASAAESRLLLQQLVDNLVSSIRDPDFNEGP